MTLVRVQVVALLPVQVSGSGDVCLGCRASLNWHMSLTGRKDL